MNLRHISGAIASHSACIGCIFPSRSGIDHAPDGFPFGLIRATSPAIGRKRAARTKLDGFATVRSPEWNMSRRQS